MVGAVQGAENLMKDGSGYVSGKSVGSFDRALRSVEGGRSYFNGPVFFS